MDDLFLLISTLAWGKGSGGGVGTINLQGRVEAQATCVLLLCMAQIAVAGFELTSGSTAMHVQGHEHVLLMASLWLCG